VKWLLENTTESSMQDRHCYLERSITGK